MGLWNVLPYLQEVGEARSSAGVGVGQVTLSATEGRSGYGRLQEVPGGSFPGSFCDDLCKATVQRLGERCERRTRAGRSEDPPAPILVVASMGDHRVGHSRSQNGAASSGIHPQGLTMKWMWAGRRKDPGGFLGPARALGTVALPQASTGHTPWAGAYAHVTSWCWYWCRVWGSSTSGLALLRTGASG